MLKVKRILYPTDFSNCAEQAFPYALYLAEKYNAELFVYHAIVLHDDDPHNPVYHFPDLAEIHTALKKVADDRMDGVIRSSAADSVTIKKVQERGTAAAPCILEYAKKKNIDAIIMGTHGRRGIGHLWLGSVAEEVVRFAGCPVLTVREEKEKKSIEAVNRILVPMDFSDHAISALSYAKEIAATFDAQLHVVHVIEESVHPACYAIGKSSVFELMPDVKNKSEKEMRRLFEESSGPSINAEYHVIEGFASSEILRFAKKNKSDLIIIATHGLTGLKHLLLGSVAEKVVRAAECPVFTVKSYGKSLL